MAQKVWKMKLIFETSGQAVSFLLAVPLGFLTCFFLCLSRTEGMVSAIFDLLILLSAAYLFFFLFVIRCSMELRCYHMLGMTAGALLCMRGFFPMVQRISAYFTKKTNPIFSRNTDETKRIDTHEFLRSE